MCPTGVGRFVDKAPVCIVSGAVCRDWWFVCIIPFGTGAYAIILSLASRAAPTCSDEPDSGLAGLQYSPQLGTLRPVNLCYVKLHYTTLW